MADFLVALADFDRQRLWVELGYPSLFYFLHRELGLSKGAAHYRKTAAELIQRCPDVVEPLRDGGGGICGSTERVEVHHVQPRALGGPATVENLSLRCRFHNDLAARRDYGDDWMGRFTDTAAKRGGTSRGEGRPTAGATPT